MSEERRQRAVNRGDCRQKSFLLRGAVGSGPYLMVPLPAKGITS